MKRLISISIALAAISLFALPQAHAAYSNYRTITVTSTPSVASGTNSNFPFEVSSTVQSWESSSTGAGARIQNLCTAPPVDGSIKIPCDFTLSSSTPTPSGANFTCNNPLNFEWESYTSSTGNVLVHINIPTMATSVITYACYGDATVTTDQSHPSSTWDSNYRMVLHLATSTATNPPDSTSNINNGTSTGGVTATTTIIDGGANFNAAGSYSQFTNSASLNNWSNQTVSFWMNMAANSGGNGGQFDRLAEKGANNEWTITENNGLHDNKTTLQTPGTSGACFTTASTTADGTWHLVEAVFASSTAVDSLYVDGLLNATSSCSGVANITTGDVFLDTFGSGPGTPYQFNGLMDEFRISNIQRSPSWILTEYNNQNSPSTFYTIGAEISGSVPGGTGEGSLLCSIYGAKIYLGKIY
jgi:hypothetical protein